jgi:hypothetical protein
MLYKIIIIKITKFKKFIYYCYNNKKKTIFLIFCLKINKKNL